MNLLIFDHKRHNIDLGPETGLFGSKTDFIWLFEISQSGIPGSKVDWLNLCDSVQSWRLRHFVESIKNPILRIDL